MKKRRFILILTLGLALIVAAPSPVHAEGEARIVRGVAKTFLSVFEIPKAMVSHSTRVLFPFGILTGTVEGSIRMVGGTLSGVTDIVVGALPYAKYGLLFI